MRVRERGERGETAKEEGVKLPPLPTVALRPFKGGRDLESLSAEAKRSEPKRLGSLMAGAERSEATA